ncbi:DUF3881 family protein [Anaerotalea alkaliphila]|uniref:DUF3881 family protein n=1 Tax=Anaerotalea alkaliphila TaxID=2662126 RepID=A0A7X5HW34_9FIRM|nr:DUF3881 family protein [Anaerotalea alkaliphila]NDL67719.1 DUF3881 family protein [Anaerotalea alkaliphila]
MILYIKALGFSEYDSREKAEALVGEVLKEPSKRFASNHRSNQIHVEYYKEYGPHYGLVARGELDDKEELKIHALLPYALGSQRTDTHEVDVVQGDKPDVFSGYCEESRSGTPISFFLQNVIDYWDLEDEEDVYIEGVRLAAFSIEGTVVLPIDKDEEELLLEAEEDRIREELLEEARRGNEEAMDILEEEADEATEMLHERMKSEDILSILEGYFVPLGDDDDIYSLLGTIEKVKKLKNKVTGESIYQLVVKCMNITIDLYINVQDMVGKPMVGMRFKGSCWIHGTIDFIDSSSRRKAQAEKSAAEETGKTKEEAPPQDEDEDDWDADGEDGDFEN